MRAIIEKMVLLKKEIIALALENSNESVQSKVSESKYYYTKWGKVRVSNHNYPTGDMTDAGMRIFDTFYINGVAELARVMLLDDKRDALIQLEEEIYTRRETAIQQERKDRFDKARATILRGANTADAYGEGITIFYTTKEARATFRASCGEFDNSLPFIYTKVEY